MCVRKMHSVRVHFVLGRRDRDERVSRRDGGTDPFSSNDDADPGVLIAVMVHNRVIDVYTQIAARGKYFYSSVTLQCRGADVGPWAGI